MLGFLFNFASRRARYPSKVYRLPWRSLCSTTTTDTPRQPDRDNTSTTVYSAWRRAKDNTAHKGLYSQDAADEPTSIMHQLHRDVDQTQQLAVIAKDNNDVQLAHKAFDTMTALVRSSSAQQLDAEERQRLHQRAAFRYTATLCGAGQVHAAVQLLLQEDGEKVVFRNPYVCGRILNALYHERHDTTTTTTARRIIDHWQQHHIPPTDMLVRISMWWAGSMGDAELLSTLWRLTVDMAGGRVEECPPLSIAQHIASLTWLHNVHAALDLYRLLYALHKKNTCAVTTPASPTTHPPTPTIHPTTPTPLVGNDTMFYINDDGDDGGDASNTQRMRENVVGLTNVGQALTNMGAHAGLGHGGLLSIQKEDVLHSDNNDTHTSNTTILMSNTTCTHFVPVSDMSKAMQIAHAHLLKHAASLSVDDVQWLIHAIASSGVPMDMQVHTSYCTMLLKHNMGTPHMELQRLIDMHTQGTPLSDGNYSLVAEIAAKKNDGVVARKTWSAMHNAAVDCTEWGHSRLIGAFADLGDVDMIQVVYDAMRAAGLQPTYFTYVAMFRGVDTVKTKAQQAYFNAHRAYSDVQHSTQHTAQHAAQQTHRNAGNADHVYSSQNDNDNDNAEYIQGREGSGSGGGRYDNEDEGGGGGGSRYDKEGNELRRDALTDAFEKLVSTSLMLSSLVQPWIQDILSTPCVPHTGTVTDSVSHDHHMHENTHGGDSNNSMHNNSSSGVLWTAGAASYVVHIVASVRLIQNAWDLLHHFKDTLSLKDPQNPHQNSTRHLIHGFTKGRASVLDHVQLWDYCKHILGLESTSDAYAAMMYRCAMDGQAHADVVQRLWVQAQKEQCANAMLYNRMVQFECTSNISNAIKLVDRMQHEGLTIDQRTLRMLTKACRQPGNTQHWRQLQNLRRRHQEDLWGGKWGVKHGGGDSGGGGGEGGGYKETSSLHSA